MSARAVASEPPPEDQDYAGRMRFVARLLDARKSFRAVAERCGKCSGWVESAEAASPIGGHQDASTTPRAPWP